MALVVLLLYRPLVVLPTSLHVLKKKKKKKTVQRVPTASAGRPTAARGGPGPHAQAPRKLKALAGPKRRPALAIYLAQRRTKGPK